MTYLTNWPRVRLTRCRVFWGGMDGGVAIIPAVPGLAPGAFMRVEGLPLPIEPTFKATAGMVVSIVALTAEMP